MQFNILLDNHRGDTAKAWRKSINEFKEAYVLERGGKDVENSPRAAVFCRLFTKSSIHRGDFRQPGKSPYQRMRRTAIRIVVCFMKGKTRLQRRTVGRSPSSNTIKAR